MNAKRILALDVSTKTGYAVIISDENGMFLEAYGTISQIHMPDTKYPGSFIEWAYLCYEKIIELVDNFAPDVFVVEETSAGSKAIYTQKILEFIHFLLAKFIKDSGIESHYIMTEQWRREIGCSMTKEEKQRNKKVREYKKKNKTRISYDENGKRIGLIGRKHVNIRRANEIFKDFLQVPLKKKEEDQADALGLAACYHFRRMKNV